MKFKKKQKQRLSNYQFFEIIIKFQKMKEKVKVTQNFDEKEESYKI